MKETEKIHFIGDNKKPIQEKSKDPTLIIENFLAFLVIPNILFYKIMGISDFGKTYYEIRGFFRSFAGLTKLDYSKLNSLK